MMVVKGERIRQLRKARNLTLMQLGEQVNKTQGYLSDLENGNIPAPSAQTIAIIADVLDTTTDYLMGRTDDPSLSNTVELTPDEKLNLIGALLRGNGANEDDIDMIMELLEARRRSRDLKRRLKEQTIKK